MSSAAPIVKAALVATCRSLYPAPVLVSYGTPGSYQPNDLVVVMSSRTEPVVGPMSPARRRDEVVETVVLFSVYRPGDETQQQVATERAFELLDVLQDYLRTSPNETLGGACREARVTEHELTETTSTNPQNPKLVTGRQSVVAAVVRTVTRV